MKLSPFQKIHKKNLKKLSKKQLIAKALTDLDMNANLMNSLETEEAIHAINRKALESAEHALRYKEKEIAHKDRLLLALTQS
jgi:hypothetical protein